MILRGLIKSGTNALIGYLPSTFRPTGRRIFVTVCYAGNLNVACRVDIASDGSVQIVGRTVGTIEFKVVIAGRHVTDAPANLIGDIKQRVYAQKYRPHGIENMRRGDGRGERFRGILIKIEKRANLVSARKSRWVLQGGQISPPFRRKSNAH